MGRRRTFIESEAISSATAAFARHGFAGVSADDLVRATGVNHVNLYRTFGSKDGLFQRCFTEALAVLSTVATPDDSADAAGAGREGFGLILMVLMEIAPGDPAVYKPLEVVLNRAGITVEAFGRRLLVRASATTSGSTPSAPTTSAPPPT